jgi:hypothetical protein
LLDLGFEPADNGGLDLREASFEPREIELVQLPQLRALGINVMHPIHHVAGRLFAERLVELP